MRKYCNINKIQRIKIELFRGNFKKTWSTKYNLFRTNLDNVYFEALHWDKSYNVQNPSL